MESKICQWCNKKYKETEFYVRHRNKRDTVCIYCRREEGRENARIKRESTPPKPPRESKIKDKKAYQHEYQQWYRKGVYRSPASIESLQRHKEKNWIEYMVNNPIYFEHIFRLEPTILNIITECKKLNLLEGNKNAKHRSKGRADTLRVSDNLGDHHEACVNPIAPQDNLPVAEEHNGVVQHGTESIGETCGVDQEVWGT
jgi:hypothetical protein